MQNRKTWQVLCEEVFPFSVLCLKRKTCPCVNVARVCVEQKKCTNDRSTCRCNEDVQLSSPSVWETLRFISELFAGTTWNRTPLAALV